MSDKDPWLTEREAARELRVSISTVRKERFDGKLGYAKVRGRVFYPMSQIRAYQLAQIKPPCPNTDSIKSPVLPVGTLSGPKDDVAAAFQLARQINKRLNSSSRRSA